MSNESSKQAILDSIRKHTKQRFERPDLAPLEAEALTFADPIAQFTEVMKLVGGRAIALAEGQTVGEVVAQCYPQAKRVANSLPQLGGAEKLPGQVFDPDQVAEPAELNGTDVAIVKATLGVCENGCCYIEQQVRHRALYFIAEALVIVLPRTALVNNMHEAFARLAQLPEAPFACFISGPSKTADIEQALVMGAHGAREVTVVLV